MEGQYSSVTFLENYFYGGGIGWWLLFFLVAAIIAIYIFYDSNRKSLSSAAFWRIGILVVLLLFLPTIIFRFTVEMSEVNEYFFYQTQINHLNEFQDVVDWRLEVEILEQTIMEKLPTLTPYYETLVYLGVIAFVAALGLGISYWLTFKDEGAQASVPESRGNVYTPPPAPIYQEPISRAPSGPAPMPYKPSKPKSNAWLVMKANGKSYQLNQGTTVIGKSTKCDIVIINDTTVSRQHLKIVEENGHFKLIDLGSTNGTWINGHRVRQTVLLDQNDEIRLGDNSTMKFVAS